ncbi:hypothetical protein H0H87_007222, partial [Tephrocybe sp. NHM501043]
MKKITKGFGKVGQKFDLFLSSKSQLSSPARESAQVTSGFSPASRVSTPPPDVVSDGNTATDVVLTPAMDLCIVATNPAVSTQGNLSRAAEVPSITVDLAKIDSASATSLTSSEIGSLVMQASTGMLAMGPLQVSGSPGTEGSIINAKAIVLQVPHSTGLAATQVINHLTSAQGPTGTGMLPILAQFTCVDPSTACNMRMKSGLCTAWSGTQMLLSRVAGLLDGTPFKMPVAAVNVLNQLANDVAENNDALKDIMASIEECLNTVATALAKEGDTVAHAMIQGFAG